MTDITNTAFDTSREHLAIPALGGFYERIAQPMAWAILRLAVGGMLVTTGWSKLMAPLAQTGFVESLGFYPGWLWSPLLAATSFFGGIMIALGLFTRPAALANGVFLGITLWYHWAHPYGGPLLTPAGIEALASQADLFTANGLSKLADGGAKFLTQVQDKAINASLYWTGATFIYAAFGGGYLSIDRVLKKHF